MLKKLFRFLILVGFSFGGIFAQGAYLGYGLGLQVNLGDLGGTITKDGLDNSLGTQKLIVPENTIDVVHRSGLVTKQTNGAMTGLILSILYENQSTNTFWRVGAEYTRKILGGHTRAQFVGYPYIDIKWDFNSLVVPFYWGLRAGVGESSAVYGGLGVNYFRGGWSLHGTSDGATPCLASSSLCGLGPNGAIDSDGNGSRDSFTSIDELYKEAIFSEQVVFDVSGIGFNFMLGIESSLQSKNKLYFEIEYLLDAALDNAPVRSLGTIKQLASTGSISYPIVIGGVRYKFGIKTPM